MGMSGQGTSGTTILDADWFMLGAKVLQVNG
jgi:hypothetical protein